MHCLIKHNNRQYFTSMQCAPKAKAQNQADPWPKVKQNVTSRHWYLLPRCISSLAFAHDSFATDPVEGESCCPLSAPFLHMGAQFCIETGTSSPLKTITRNRERERERDIMFACLTSNHAGQSGNAHEMIAQQMLSKHAIRMTFLWTLTPTAFVF